MSSPGVELLVVGAGPTGLYAAHYAGFRGLSVTVVDALDEVGGQIAAFYPDETIYDVPGFPAVRARDLVARLEAQARRFPVDIRLGEDVRSLDRVGGAIRVTTWSRAGGERHLDAGAVLLACGIGALAPQRVVDPEMRRFEGAGLEYAMPDASSLRGRRVLVVGGNERAVAMALAAAAAGASTRLAHRRDRLAAGPEAHSRLSDAGVEFFPFRELVALAGESRVATATLADRRSTVPDETLAVDLVLACHGVAASAESLRRFGVELDGDAVVVDSRMRSSAPGIWAAGDAAAYPGKVRLLAADLGEACTAVNNLATQLIPGARLFPGYSSHAGGSARRRPDRS